jgi:hypothetical protein
MKYLVLLLFLPVLAFGQANDNLIILAYDSTYSATTDTTSWIQISPWANYHLVVTAACDTANFAILMDYYPFRAGATYYQTYTVADSTAYAGSAAGRLMFKSYDLTGDIVGGAYVRLRVTKMTTGGNIAGGTESYRAYLLRRD